MAEAVTLDDVARVSGVSRAAASRALNGRDGVRPDVRERVRRVAASLDYRPNRAAKHLASGRASVIGFVMPSDELRLDPYGASLVQAVAAAADRNDEGLMLLLARSEPTRSVRTTLLDGLIDGVIVSAVAIGAEWVEELLDARIPSVLVGSHPHRRDIPSVEVENLEATASATEHLLAQGYVRVAHIGGPTHRVDAAERAQGFRLAHERRGLEVDADLVVRGDYTRRSGGDAMVRLLDTGVDAVVAANDEMAIGAMRAIERAGLRVPGDVAVSGFDGTSAIEGLEPTLTSLHQPFRTLADRAVETLQAIIDGDEVPRRQVVAPHLVLGESTARPPT